MTFFGGLFKGLAAAVVSLLALGLFSAAAVPTADFSMTPPGNPVVGQSVQFTDKSEGGPTSWSWNFGDGTTSTQQSPIHAYAVPGTYTVTLAASNGQGQSVPEDRTVIVSPSTALRLNAPHPFEVTILAEDPATARTDTGRAIPQNDVFGYFIFPVLVQPDPDPAKVVPEVFVKLLDATSIPGQNYWVFYGGLTSLKYTLKVKELSTGNTKTYVKPGFPDPASASGGFDTSGFHATPTPPSATATPTPTPTAPAATVVSLVASNFKWSFNGGGESFTFHAGQPYQVRVSRANGSHQFSGVPGLNWPGTSFSSALVIDFTPTAAQIRTYGFACTNSGCGSGHSDMQNGQVIVAP